MSTREWTQRMQEAAAGRLPDSDRAALTTDQLADNGSVVNVWQRLHVDPAEVDSLWGNWRGIEQTAQVASPPPAIEGGHIQRPAWEGFHDIEVPVGMDDSQPSRPVELFGRLGDPAPDREIAGSYVIITHGLFGSLDGLDMENQVQALRKAGHHVLALEMRGHGETNCRHPEYVITFGIQETGDLLAAARWLKQTQGASRVGLVSFSITGYESLLAAWLDGNHGVQGFEGSPILMNVQRCTQNPVSLGPAEPAFNGGMFIISAPIGIVSLADRFEQPLSIWDAPLKATFQEHVAARLKAYGAPPGHSMWDLARSEFSRSPYSHLYAGGSSAASFERMRKDFLDLVDFSRGNRPWEVGVERMEHIRAPVLLLSAANDPLGTAQNVAELFGRVKNPNVGVILLREGGHMGFSAVSADYYYSLMVNFFDPRTAPGVARERSVAAGDAD